MQDSPRPQPAPLPALRASDAEREHTVELLRRAAGEGRLDLEELDERLALAYATKTKAELERLTVDVVVPGTGGAPAPATPVTAGPGGTRTIVSVMSGAERKGRWQIAPRLRVISVMGGADLDLSEAQLSDRVTRITVISIMGGADIRLPDGVEVQASKFGFMGGNDVRVSSTPPPPGAPVIELRLFALMGGNGVKQGRKLSKAQRRALKRAQREETP